MDLITFAQEVTFAEATAKSAAAPFVPSRAQQLAALSAVVDNLLRMSYPEAVRYIRATYAPSGLMPLAVVMFRAARDDRMVFNSDLAQRAMLALQAMYAAGMRGRLEFPNGVGIRLCEDGSVHVFSRTSKPDEAYPNTHAFKEAYGLA